MFATDAALQLRTRGATFLNGHFDQLANTRFVDLLERVGFEDLLFQVVRQERANVVATVTEGHLSQVVRAEAEELGRFGDLISSQRSTRNLDHRADHVFDFGLLLFEDPVSHAANDLLQEVQLGLGADQRDHDFRQDFGAFGLNLDGSFDDRLSLHFAEDRVGDAQAATAMTQHRVELVQLGDAFLDLGQWNLHFGCHLLHVCFGVRQEFVKWRIQQANGNRQAVHRLEDAFEVFALVRQKLLDGFGAILFGVGQDEAADVGNAIAFEEHVLGAAQADAFSTKRTSVLRIFW